jgi:hypothetical protein
LWVPIHSNQLPEVVPSSVGAFLYPGYASYKTLSQRPASEEELERWLMYWSVLGCIIGVEYIAEWAVSWYDHAFTRVSLIHRIAQDPLLLHLQDCALALPRPSTNSRIVVSLRKPSSAFLPLA